MYKWIAILLIFSCCSIIGLFQSGQLTRRKKLLLQYRDLLQKLDTEMGYFKEPLPLIFQRLQTADNEPADILLRQCLLQMRESSTSISELWSKAIESAYENEPLKTEDIAIFSKCGTFLGQSDFRSQKGHFTLLQGELEKQIREAEENIRTKGSLYSKAGFSIGAVIAIALL